MDEAQRLALLIVANAVQVDSHTTPWQRAPPVEALTTLIGEQCSQADEPGPHQHGSAPRCSGFRPLQAERVLQHHVRRPEHVPAAWHGRPCEHAPSVPQRDIDRAERADGLGGHRASPRERPSGQRQLDLQAVTLDELRHAQSPFENQP